ncbi:MAG TPA: tetratricopeptide repeat protein, partial [Xylella fastidiosa subsp. pauca]
MKPTFWFLTLLFTLATLSLALKPLWPQARGTLAMSLLLLSLAAAALYTLVGTPQALQPAQIAAPQTLDAAIAQLRDTLHQHPERIEGWMLLGHALRQQQHFGEAQKALTEAGRRAPNNPDILMATAEIRMHM